MMERYICRRCEASRSQGKSARGRKPFASHGAIPHYAPDLPFRVENILLEVDVDPVNKKLAGKVTQRVRTVASGQKLIRLDQIGLQISDVFVAGKKADFTVEGHFLKIHLASEPRPDEIFEFSVQYQLENPKRGLYFTGPDSFYPQKPYQVWTQGQDEDSRYWFPAFDYPNQKATSEIIATVPRGYTAVSNGALLERAEIKAEGSSPRTRFHYRLGTPHVTYLITLVVAELEAWEDQGPRGLPVQYFVAPGRVEDGKRAFSNTPLMIDTFEQKTGVPYPYEKYSQAAVQDFIFGGMENTSATTQTDTTLHDARAHLDFTSDPLVSHELAHQWFGDLLTCRDWSHGWLNEGFATFMERIWIEAKSGPDGGFEEAKYYSYQDLKEYLLDDQTSYRRPIVCNQYIEPIDLFDAHLYQKGGLVLNLIRHLLGEESFWKSISTYVKRHRGQSVETLDLVRAIEDSTGRNLRRVFDEWVFQGGYPEFELSYQWHDDKKVAEVVIQQKQTGGESSKTVDGVITPLFHLPANLEFSLEGGGKVIHRVELGEARERLFIPVQSKPLMVRFDRDHWIPKTLSFPRPKELLLYQLRNDPDCMGRIEAIQELVKILDQDVTPALSKVLVEDPFWGVQAEAAEALGKLRTEKARDALISALGEVKNPKARRAIVKALGTYQDTVASLALRVILDENDHTRAESYFVESEAIRAYALSIARLQAVSPGAPTAEIASLEEYLLSQLEKSSYREVIRCMTLRALGDLPGVGRGERPKAMDAIIEWTRRGHEQDARLTALETLGRLCRTATQSEKARIFEVFSHLSDEEGFRIRMALIGALRDSDSPEGIGLLAKIHRLELDGRARRRSLEAMDELTTAGGTPESITTLKAAMDKLDDEYRKLRSWMENRAKD